METENSQNNNPINDPNIPGTIPPAVQPQPTDNLPSTSSKKKLIFIIGGIVLIVIVSLIAIFLVMNMRAQPVLDNQIDDQMPAAVPTNSPELQKAIDETKQIDQEYDRGQQEILTEYPWIRKLPLASEKYYVYYDLEKKKFIGKLYPTATDNVGQMKAAILQDLMVNKEIPVENYEFEWIVNP